MLPRKKPAITAGGSKKSNQIQQQSFGIHYFSERHSRKHQNPNTPHQYQTTGSDPVASTEVRDKASSDPGINPRSYLAPGNSKKNDVDNTGAKDPSPSTAVEDLIKANDGRNQLEVSPEFYKLVLPKRIKISPGMLIHQNQSQDDGGDELTWRISPVNEQLHALTKNPSFVPKPSAESSLKLLKGINLESRNLEQDMILCGNNEKASDNKSNTSFWSPFKTPPSCHHHHQALFELLDQVEDVISVDNQACRDTTTLHYNKQNNEIPFKPEAVERPSVGSTEKAKPAQPSVYFLVLEVSETQFVGSNGYQFTSKVLSLLDEEFGEERSVYFR